MDITKQPDMKIKIKAFATTKEIFGFNEKELIVSEEITVHEVVDQLKKSYDKLDDLNGKLLYAINEKYCSLDSVLSDEDTLAIFPPVSGG